MSDEKFPDTAHGADDEMPIADKVAMLEKLRAEHRHLDTDIRALYDLGITDMLKIARMKKLKLKIKDRIMALEDEITPDIIA